MSPSPIRKSLFASVAAAVLAFGGSGALAQSAPAAPGAQDRELFPEVRHEDRGWKGLAKILESLEPEVDTSIPLTPSEITNRISVMLDQGRAEEALQVIEKRQAQYAARPDPLGNDVQLMFLHARALAALQRHEEAIAIYQDMTNRYPELPEPWNNLAAEYVMTGRLEMARQALEMALHAKPGYPDALRNLGRVQLLMAEESFRAAEQAGR